MHMRPGYEALASEALYEQLIYAHQIQLRNMNKYHSNYKYTYIDVY